MGGVTDGCKWKEQLVFFYCLFSELNRSSSSWWLLVNTLFYMAFCVKSYICPKHTRARAHTHVSETHPV